jgi:hypothetical protein
MGTEGRTKTKTASLPIPRATKNRAPEHYAPRVQEVSLRFGGTPALIRPRRASRGRLRASEGREKGLDEIGLPSAAGVDEVLPPEIRGKVASDKAGAAES